MRCKMTEAILQRELMQDTGLRGTGTKKSREQHQQRDVAANAGTQLTCRRISWTWSLQIAQSGGNQAVKNPSGT